MGYISNGTENKRYDTARTCLLLYQRFVNKEISYEDYEKQLKDIERQIVLKRSTQFDLPIEGLK